MAEFITLLFPFVVILNPFALCLYLTSATDELRLGEFIHVVGGASLVSLVVLAVFCAGGEYLLVEMLGIRPWALRAFGGVIFLIVGYNYVTQGYRAAEMLRGSLEELPASIALPFMIGAGTITQAILIGKGSGVVMGLVVLLVGVGLSFGILVGFKLLRDKTRREGEKFFDRYVNILARINGLLIGSFAIQMLVTGVHELWLLPTTAPVG